MLSGKIASITVLHHSCKWHGSPKSNAHLLAHASGQNNNSHSCFKATKPRFCISSFKVGMLLCATTVMKCRSQQASFPLPYHCLQLGMLILLIGCYYSCCSLINEVIYSTLELKQRRNNIPKCNVSPNHGLESRCYSSDLTTATHAVC